MRACAWVCMGVYVCMLMCVCVVWFAQRLMLFTRDFCSSATAQAQLMTVGSLGLCHQPATPVLVLQQAGGPKRPY